MPVVSHAELALDKAPLAAPRNQYHFLSVHYLYAGIALLAIMVMFRLVACRLFCSAPGKRNGLGQQPLHNALFAQQDDWMVGGKSCRDSGNNRPAALHSTPKSDAHVDEKELSGTEGEKSDNDDGPSCGGKLALGSLLSKPPHPEPSPPVSLSEGHRISLITYLSEAGPPSSQQPKNPDSISCMSTGAWTATASRPTTPSSPMPRRRSRTKTVPIVVPALGTGPLVLGEANALCSPCMLPPPTEPLVRGPPPILGELRYDETTKREILVQGDMMSFLDDAGVGWKRHTQVYGGGPCLACAASAGVDGHHGGVYGKNVLPEEKRY